MEQWKAIPGYEGLYEVSDHGNVRSVDRIVDHPKAGPSRRKSLLLKQNRSHNYLAVNLSQDGVITRWTVHRLVLNAFVGLRGPQQQCRHLNGNPKDNRLANLAWGTANENTADKVSHGTVKGPPRALTNVFNIRCIRQMAKLGISDREIAKCFDTSKGTVYNIVRGNKGYAKFT